MEMAGIDVRINQRFINTATKSGDIRRTSTSINNLRRTGDLNEE